MGKHPRNRKGHRRTSMCAIMSEANFSQANCSCTTPRTTATPLLPGGFYDPLLLPKDLTIEATQNILLSSCNTHMAAPTKAAPQKILPSSHRQFAESKILDPSPQAVKRHQCRTRLRQHRRASATIISNTEMLMQPAAEFSPPSQSSASDTPPSLTTEINCQPKAANGVPIIVEACLRYFSANATECEGLFRVPGKSDRVDRLWTYMEDHPVARLSINCVEAFMRNNPEFSPRDAASFLKRFIKSMVADEHVVTDNCYQPLVDLANSRCPSDLKAEQYRHILGRFLAPARRVLLGRLCNFLRDFCAHEAKTNMDFTGFAACFAYLMQPPPENIDAKINRPMNAKQLREFFRAQALTDGRKKKLCVDVINTLIKESEDIFIMYKFATTG